MIPIRLIFRSRWAALAWVSTICLSAIEFAGDHQATPVDAAQANDGKAASAGALAAESPE